MAVADTKYKGDRRPTTNDVAQVVAYAEQMETESAILIYPTALDTSVDFQVGNVRVRDLQFRLNGAIDRMGDDFMSALFTLLDP